MKIYNLNSFKKYEQYYNYYIDNNSKLKEIINDIIKKYNFGYNPEKYYRLNEKCIGTRNINELSGLIIMLNAIIEKNFYGYCIKTGNKYKCEKMYCSNNSQFKFEYTTYHFNCAGDEFIIVFGWEYFSPKYIYYPKDELIFNISYRHSKVHYLIDINYSRPYFPKDNYISYSLGMCVNPGHYLWQEIFGLNLLFEYNLLENIDEFIIYKYDYINFAGILKNSYFKNVIHLVSDTLEHNLCVNLSKHFINNSLIETFRKVYDLKDLSGITKNKEINVLFDIRTNDRIWLNQNIIIINIMNGLKNRYFDYNVNFYISGFYNFKRTQINNNYDYNKEINLQNSIFDTIQKCVNFPIHNLINVNLCDLLKICEKIDICLCNLGSGISFFFQTIFNKDSVGVTLKQRTYDFDIQRYAFENYISNITVLDSKYIVDDNKGNFNVKFGYLLPLIESKIDKLIKNN